MLHSPFKPEKSNHNPFGLNQEHPGTGKVIRLPSTAQFLIDSLDRYPAGFPPSYDLATTSSLWTLQLQQIAMNGYIHRLAVTEVNFQWNLPTIITGYNDQILFIATGSGGVKTATLNPGYYTPTTLATEIAAEMNAVTSPNLFTVTFSAATQFSFRITSASTFQFLPSGSTPSRYTRCYQTLGIVPGGTLATIQITNPPTMLPTRYIDICSAYLTKNQNLKDTNTLQKNIQSDCIARVFPTAPNNQVALSATASIGSLPLLIHQEYTFPKQITWSPSEAIGNFDLYLLDENAQPLPWSVYNSCEYTMVMQASES